MRYDPNRLRFEVKAREGSARAGTITTAHGDIRTPAFIPLATKGTVRSLMSHEVADLGYGLILGNTYHLLVSPGPERIQDAGGLHEFMGWDRSLITDSGGFQVFSLAHGGVAEEIKGTGGRAGDEPAILEIKEEGVRFRSYKDGSELFLSPEVSMQVQAALGSDIALVLDECTPFHAEPDYTRRSTERTHRWLKRCLEWHDLHGPSDQAVFGIVQGGVYPELRRESAGIVSESAIDGIAIGGTLGRDKSEMYWVLEVTQPLLPEDAPKHLLGIGEVDDLLKGIELGLDIFDCAVPTRLARHGVALSPDPERRFRLDMRKSWHTGSRDPLVRGCECATCRDYDRDYVSYLSRAHELTAVRMLVLHNLAYMQSLMDSARQAIVEGAFGRYASEIRAGKTPWEAIAAGKA